jgi:subtilase family serine protease
MGDILSSMVTWTQIKQFSSSWSFGGYDSSAEGYLMQMASQGQSFFMAAGDGDAWVNGIGFWPAEDPYLTCVGGTTLTMSGTNYISETVWQWGYRPPGWSPDNGNPINGEWSGSGGGVSTDVVMPIWQQGVNMAAVGGSMSMRNIPDVAMNADNIAVYYNLTRGSCGGTSAAAPLWAGFTALVNQQAAACGQPSVGFLNPALYAIGRGPNYTQGFHDITVGNNTNVDSANLYFAAPGYDLCTGWGTPNGQNLISELMPYNGAVWVDFDYTGTQNGTYDAPYNTLSNGVSAVSRNGNLWIRTSGVSPETMTISKPMTIRAYNGYDTIGKQ